MPRIAFISCSKTKLGYPAPACKLYQGTLFKKSLKYCTDNFDVVYILSAKYGLLELNQIIEPYEETLNNKTKIERKIWSEKVKKQIQEKQIHGVFWFFTGEKYHEFFTGEKPLSGLSLGRCLSWFNHQKKGFGL
jgi:cytoplasmic iron level regulating protein YaaA (DUF328/UPF0246 family)